MQRADSADSSQSRIDALDWQLVEDQLDAEGHAILPRLLSDEQCDLLGSLDSDAERFRSRIVMENHGYGRGVYQYFRYPLPALVAGLRSHLYARLAPVARRWNQALGLRSDFPPALEQFLERCHAAGQTRPTPLLLRYGTGDFNRLHQDLYGDHVFPLQATILLSQPGTDFTGGEFVMTEQRARMQSRPMVVALARGDAVVFAVGTRPIATARGTSRVVMRHGVSRVLSGDRRTAGIIFHDAR